MNLKLKEAASGKEVNEFKEKTGGLGPAFRRNHQ
jgi:hypothetical protein